MANLLRIIKDGAEKAPVVMEGPASDWVPVFMYEDGSGMFRTGAIQDMTRETLPIAAEYLRSVLTEAKAVQAALVLPTWFNELTGDGVTKTERVMVTYVSRDRTRIEAAEVIRSKTEKPRLGPWDRYADNLEVSNGLFLDAMRTAIE